MNQLNLMNTTFELLSMGFFIGINVILLEFLIYFIVKRVQKKKTEKFEKREY